MWQVPLFRFSSKENPFVFLIFFLLPYFHLIYYIVIWRGSSIIIFPNSNFLCGISKIVDYKTTDDIHIIICLSHPRFELNLILLPATTATTTTTTVFFSLIFLLPLALDLYISLLPHPLRNQSNQIVCCLFLFFFQAKSRLYIGSLLGIDDVSQSPHVLTFCLCAEKTNSKVKPILPYVF